MVQKRAVDECYSKQIKWIPGANEEKHKARYYHHCASQYAWHNLDNQMCCHYEKYLFSNEVRKFQPLSHQTVILLHTWGRFFLFLVRSGFRERIDQYPQEDSCNSLLEASRLPFWCAFSWSCHHFLQHIFSTHLTISSIAHPKLLMFFHITFLITDLSTVR